MSGVTARSRIDYRRPRNALATVDSAVSLTQRERSAFDFYCEPRWAVDALLDAEPFSGLVWDPAAGRDNIPEACRARDIQALGTDLVQRGVASVTAPVDFLVSPIYRPATIICNPPFALAERFIERALSLAERKVAMLLRLGFTEGGNWQTVENPARRERAKLRDWCLRTAPLARVLVFSSRVSMPPGDSAIEAKGGAVAFAWYVWVKGHEGPPALGWLRKPA